MFIIYCQRHRHLPGVGAAVVAHNRFTAAVVPPVPRRLRRPEAREAVRSRPGEILEAFGGLIVHHEEIDSIFRAAHRRTTGNLIRSKDLDEVRAAAAVHPGNRP